MKHRKRKWKINNKWCIDDLIDRYTDTDERIDCKQYQILWSKNPEEINGQTPLRLSSGVHARESFRTEQSPVQWGFKVKELLTTSGSDSIKSGAHSIEERLTGEVEAVNWTSLLSFLSPYGSVSCDDLTLPPFSSVSWNPVAPTNGSSSGCF